MDASLGVTTPLLPLSRTPELEFFPMGGFVILSPRVIRYVAGKTTSKTSIKIHEI